MTSFLNVYSRHLRTSRTPQNLDQKSYVVHRNSQNVSNVERKEAQLVQPLQKNQTSNQPILVRPLHGKARLPNQASGSRWDINIYQTFRTRPSPLPLNFFDDDLLLFANGLQGLIWHHNESSWQVLWGQKVNLHKSSMISSKGVDESLVSRLSHIVNIPIFTNPDKYLRVLFIMGRINNGIFQYILDSMEWRLEGCWAWNLTCQVELCSLRWF